MDDIFRDTSSQARSACTECQRRKQKCNREWPCNHCQKRKVADKCRFNQPNQVPLNDKPAPPVLPKNPPLSNEAQSVVATNQKPEPSNPVVNSYSPSTQVSKKKRQLSGTNDYGDGEDSDAGEEDAGLGALGYMTTKQFSGLGIEAKKERPAPREYFARSSGCAQLERALQVLPLRPHTDALVQNFFNNVNYHYYILYPPIFLQEYQSWWEKRAQNRPLSLQWTCLLLMVCACACQHLPIDMQEKLELEMSETAQQLTEKYHDTARELASVVPVGYYHIYNVQWLLHSTYWYKAEARFLECWHVLGAAAREAQELGLHRNSEELPEFEREMRRRVWCVVDCWDWQISSGLFRPTIIDRTDCDVELPTLTLEDYSPSPLMHMKLQSELIGRLAQRFGAPKNVISTSDVLEYKLIIDDWMQSFPPAYALENPDRSGDERRPWITFHRHYIHTMGYMMLLNRIRSFMTMDFSGNSPLDLLAIRADGVDYSLKLMEVLREWMDFVSYRDGRYHFIIFSLFDTAAVLSTALIKDEDQTIPSRDECFYAIEFAVAMLKKIMALSVTAKMSYDILYRIVRKVPKPPKHSRYGSKKNGKTRLSPKGIVLPRSLSTPAPPPNPAATLKAIPISAPAPMFDLMPVPVSQSYCVSASTAGPAPPPLDGFGACAASTASGSHCQGLSHTFTPPGSFIAVDSVTAVSTPPSEVIAPQCQIYSSSDSAPGSVHGYNSDGDKESPISSVDSVHEQFHAGTHSDDEPSEGRTLEQSPENMPVQDLGFGNITDAELGELATLWNWQSLNLDFISSEAAASTGMQAS